MSKFVAFTVLALTGAVLVASEPALSAGRIGAFPGGRIAIPRVVIHHPRARLLRRPHFAFPRNAFRPTHLPYATVPSRRPFATTTPLHPFGFLARRHHRFYKRIYQDGAYFPVTF